MDTCALTFILRSRVFNGANHRVKKNTRIAYRQIKSVSARDQGRVAAPSSGEAFAVSLRHDGTTVQFLDN
jgi:hypothetical protein